MSSGGRRSDVVEEPSTELFFDNTARASQSLHELSGELSTLTQRLSA